MNNTQLAEKCHKLIENGISEIAGANEEDLNKITSRNDAYKIIIECTKVERVPENKDIFEELEKLIDGLQKAKTWNVISLMSLKMDAYLTHLHFKYV